MGNEHQSAGPKCGDQNGAVDGARGLRVGEVQERKRYQSLGDHVDRVGEVLAWPIDVLVCAVRVASHPVSMKAPRISIQLKLNMNRATCTARPDSNSPSSTRMKRESRRLDGYRYG